MPQQTLSAEEMDKLTKEGKASPVVSPNPYATLTPPQTISDAEVQAMIKNGGAPLVTSTPKTATTSTRPTPAPTPDFMDQPLPGITQNLGVTPRHVTRALGAAKDSVVGTGQMLWNMATDPISLLGPGAAGLKYMGILPAKEQLEKAAQAQVQGRTSETVGHTLAAAVPGVGPMAAHVGERLGAGEIPELAGETAAGVLMGRALESAPGVLKGEMPGMPGFRKLSNVIDKDQMYAMQTIAPKSIHNTLPDVMARAVQPTLKQFFQENGLDPNKISIKDLSPKTDLRGDLVRGIDSKSYSDLAKKLGKTVDELGPLPIEAAHGAVDIANRPFELAIDKMGDLPSIQLAIDTSNKLREMGNKYENMDPALYRGFNLMADEILAKGRTVRGMNDFKAHLNKEASRMNDMGPGKYIDATATPIYAMNQAAKLIRERLYPFIEDATQGKIDLKLAGQQEQHAIAFRDSLYDTWYEAAGEQAPAALKTYVETILKGTDPYRAVRFPRATGAGIVSRMFTNKGLPLQQFNKMFKQAVGGIEGFVPPPMPSIDKYVPPQALVGTQQDLVPHDIQSPLFEPPGGVSSNIGQSIQGVQQRANQQARTAPPPTLAGQQSTMLPGANVAKPAEPFYPGPMGLRYEPNPVEGQPPIPRDYSNQGQLFGLGQTKILTKADMAGSTGEVMGGVPTGTTLVSKAHDMSTGQILYHYKTAEGMKFTTDFEIPAEALKPKKSPKSSKPYGFGF